MYHMFDVDIAVKYGVNAAILLYNIYFWCQKNKANRRNFFDGSYWTYNSRSAFTEIFPYLSERQIKTALDKLIDDGIIKTGRYNKDARDRSLWYAMTEKGLRMVQTCSEQNAEMSNGYDDNVRPLPDIKTPDVKPDNKPDESKRKRFTPPTVDDVRAYAREKGYTIDAERFVDFYASKGWMVGKSPMKDWRASVRNWVSRDHGAPSPTSAPTVYTDPDYENYW